MTKEDKELEDIRNSMSPVNSGGIRNIKIKDLERGDWVKVELGFGGFYSGSHSDSLDIIEFFGLVERVKCLHGGDADPDYDNTYYWMVVFRTDIKVCFYADDELLLLGRFKRELERGL